MKIVAISDTHGKHQQLDMSQYPGNCLIHAGDFTARDIKTQIIQFLEWFSIQDYKHLILIAGNHERLVESDLVWFNQVLTHFPTIIYLQDSEVIIDGIKFYGFPHTPEFCNWAFNKTPFELSEVYSKIPKDTDVLICHGPPKGILDKVSNNFSADKNVGCERLRRYVLNSSLKTCIFGHIHEQGCRQFIKNNCTYINASVLNERYSLNNLDIVSITV